MEGVNEGRNHAGSLSLRFLVPEEYQFINVAQGAHLKRKLSASAILGPTFTFVLVHVVVG